MKTAALYMRVSTLDQRPETQLHDLRAIAQQCGLEIVKEYTPLFRHFVERKRRGRQAVQEFLRHANSRITLDAHTQTVNSNKRAAQSEVVKMIGQTRVRKRRKITREL